MIRDRERRATLLQEIENIVSLYVHYYYYTWIFLARSDKIGYLICISVGKYVVGTRDFVRMSNGTKFGVIWLLSLLKIQQMALLKIEII